LQIIAEAWILFPFGSHSFHLLRCDESFPHEKNISSFHVAQICVMCGRSGDKKPFSYLFVHRAFCTWIAQWWSQNFEIILQFLSKEWIWGTLQRMWNMNQVMSFPIKKIVNTELFIDGMWTPNRIGNSTKRIASNRYLWLLYEQIGLL